MESWNIISIEYRDLHSTYKYEFSGTKSTSTNYMTCKIWRMYGGNLKLNLNLGGFNCKIFELQGGHCTWFQCWGGFCNWSNSLMVNYDEVILGELLILTNSKAFITLSANFLILSQQFLPEYFLMSPPHSQTSMLPYSFIFLIIITSHLVQLPRFGWAVNETFTSCRNLSCWDKAINYPSMIAGPKDYCGHPIYELECPEVNHMATATSRKYQVLWENQTMTIVRMNLSDGKCPQEPGDFTLDKSLFSYTVGNSSATLFYNCRSQLHPNMSNFNCSMRDGFGLKPTTILPDDASRYAETCSSNISIPTPKSLVLNFLHTSIDDNKVVRDGFEVMWVLDRKECNTNEGIFRCFCPEGAYKSTCPQPAPDPPDCHVPPAKRLAPAPEAQSSMSSFQLWTHNIYGFEHTIQDLIPSPFY